MVIGQLLLPQSTFKTQTYSDATSYWSERNKMILNQDKSNYMVISRPTDQFSLRVILDIMYVDYTSALEMSALKTLHGRRERRSLSFAIKCSSHKTNISMFPLNPIQDIHSDT